VLGNTLLNLGIATLRLGDFSAAEGLLEEALALHRTVGGRSVANVLHSLADAALQQGRLQDAQRQNAEAFLFCEVGNRKDLAEALEGLASVAAARGMPGCSAGPQRCAPPSAHHDRLLLTHSWSTG
jgi:hypothetical protein